MNRSMIFHYPLPLTSSGVTGSQVRSSEMVRAFEALGYEVHTVAGYAGERKRQIRQIQHEQLNGRAIDFLYSESAAAPAMLTERHHLPLNPRLDFEFFRWLRSRNIPIWALLPRCISAFRSLPNSRNLV